MRKTIHITLPTDRQALGRTVSYLPDGAYSITFETQKKKCTPNQHRLYRWYFLKKLLMEFKDRWIVYANTDYLHADLAGMFALKEKYNLLTGEHDKYVESTANFLTKEFKEYMERINDYLMDRFSFHIDLSITDQDLLYWESLFL